MLEKLKRSGIALYDHFINDGPSYRIERLSDSTISDSGIDWGDKSESSSNGSIGRADEYANLVAQSNLVKKRLTVEFTVSDLYDQE